MAEFNANINVNAKVNKALDAVSKLERRIAKIEDITVKLNVEGRQEFKRIGDSFKRLAAIIKTSGVVTAVAAVTGSLQSLNNLPVIGGGLNTTALGKVVSQLGAFSNAAVDAAASAPGLAAGIAASTAALIAFAPQLSRATKDTLKLARVAAEAKAPLQNVLNLIGAASSSGTLGGFGDAAAGVEEFRRRLFELNESVSNLQKRANSLKSALDRFNSGSATAEKIAEKLVDVNARLNEELREQADLLRRVAGVNVTELEASKGRNSIETKKRRESFLKEQAQEANAVTQSLQKLEEAEAKLNNERLDARAEQEQIRLEQKLRAENDESIRSIRRRNQIEERVANARSARIARATQFARNLDDKFGQAPRALPSTEILNPEGRGIKRLSSFYGDLNTQIDKGVSNAKEFTNELSTQAAKAQGLPLIFNQVARAFEKAQTNIQEIGTLARQNRRQGQLFRGRANRQQRTDLNAEAINQLERINKLETNRNLQVQLRNKSERLSEAIKKNEFTTAKQLRDEINKLLNLEEKRIDVARRQLAFRKKQRKEAKQEADDLAKRRSQLGESLALGAGFPALFGAGPGSITGSAFGSFFGSGFGGQILGGAIGQAFDGLTEKSVALAQALRGNGDAAEALEAVIGGVDRQTKIYIQNLQQSGQLVKAAAVVQEELARKIGVENAKAYVRAGQRVDDTTASLGKFLNVLVAISERAQLFDVRNPTGGTPNGIFDLLPPELRPKKREIKDTEALNRRVNESKESLAVARLEREVAEATLTTDIERIDAAKRKLAAEQASVETLAVQRDLAERKLNREQAFNAILEIEERFQTKLLSLDKERTDAVNQRANAQERATKAAEREAARAAERARREAEAATRAEQQVQRTLAAQQTRDFNLDTQFQTLGATPLDAVNIELQRLTQLKTLKENQIILSGEDARIQAAKLANLDTEFLIESEKLKLRQQTLQIEKQIQAIRNRQENEGITRQLTQELNSFQLPTGNPFEDERSNLLREQENRRQNILAEINNQLEIQKELQKELDEKVSKDATKRIGQLEKQKSIYESLLTQISAAEQAQLKFNQALSLVQGPVDAFVGGLVSGLQDVIAGTKSAEEAFADFLSGIANALIQTAATLIAQYIAIGIARKFAGLPPAGGGGSGTGTAGLPRITNQSDLFNGSIPFFGTSVPSFFADGGRPPVGETSIVGERGPELFVPDRPGTIVPNEFFDAARQALQPSGGNISDSSDTSEAFAAATAALERNTTNIVNRQSTVSQETSFNNFAESLRSEQRQPIRFETVRVGEIDMVTKEEALKIGADSAKAAEASVFSALKNKPSVRRSIGMS